MKHTFPQHNGQSQHTIAAFPFPVQVPRAPAMLVDLFENNAKAKEGQSQGGRRHQSLCEQSAVVAAFDPARGEDAARLAAYKRALAAPVLDADSEAAVKDVHGNLLQAVSSVRHSSGNAILFALGAYVTLPDDVQDLVMEECMAFSPALVALFLPASYTKASYGVALVLGLLITALVIIGCLFRLARKANKALSARCDDEA